MNSDAEKFGKEARLYPFLNKQVSTPKGKGILAQVFGEWSTVELDKNPKILTRIRSSEINPT